jgi:hypothetical protein
MMLARSERWGVGGSSAPLAFAQPRTDIWNRTTRPRALLASWPTIASERYVSNSAITRAPKYTMG